MGIVRISFSAPAQPRDAESAHVPLESPKDSRSLYSWTDVIQIRATSSGKESVIFDVVLQIVVKHGECNEARKPEEHGQGIEPKDGIWMGDLRHEARGEGKVEEDEHRPYGCEEKEGVLGWCCAIGCDCVQRRQLSRYRFKE